MKEIKIYEADDGTQFTTEQSCIEYEEKLYPDRPVMLDYDGDETTDYDCAYYLIVRNTAEGKYALQKMLHDSNLNAEFKKDIETDEDNLLGIWKYDEIERIYLWISESDIDILNKARSFYHKK